MGLSMKLVFILIIPLCPCFAVKASKACFGAPGLPCTYHRLSCSRGQIAVQEAFYTDSTYCGGGVSNCANNNFSSIQLNGTIYNFNDTELDSLYKNCSTQSTCRLKAGRRGPMGTKSFSAIKYQCINETIDMCNVTSIQRSKTYFLWSGPSEQKTCVCSISKHTTRSTMLTIRAFDLRHHCEFLTLSGVGSASPFRCSNLNSNQFLYNSTNWSDIRLTVNNTNAKNNSIVWIAIEATDNLSIVCNENPTSEPVEATTMLRPARSPTTAKQGTLTSPTPSRLSAIVPPDQTTMKEIGTETVGTTTPTATIDKNATLNKDAESNTGTVVGIIVPTCIIIAGVVTAIIIFRRRKLRQTGKNGKVVKPKLNPQEVYSLERKFSPEYDYATANEYLDLVPQTHTMRSPQYDDADDDHYHQVEHMQTKTELPESNHSLGNKNDKLNFQSSVGDCPEGNYHELEPQTELGSSEYNLASKMESHNVKTLPGKKGSSEYATAGNISKGGKEFQQAKKGSFDYDCTGGNTYHVLERQSALRDSSDYDYAGGNDYHEVETQESNVSDNDYATCGNQQANHRSSSRNTQTRDSNYDHFGREQARANGHHDTTLSIASTLEGRSANDEVYSYNHLNEKAVTNIHADLTYNTTASTRHKMDSSINDMEDDYGYNHLGTESKKNLPQNEYDTSASAIRDVARMNRDMEASTYDHAHLLTSDSSPSGMANAGFQESDYDHVSLSTTSKDEYESNASRNQSYQEEGVADVYTLAGEADTNPYQLAK